jgi:hypothetical protein
MKLEYTFTRKFFLEGPAFPQTPQGGKSPLQFPHVEECTIFLGVKSSWGINMTENKDL